MKNNIVYPAQLETQSFGRLRVNASSVLGARPISNATIRIYESNRPEHTIEEIKTNNIGQSDTIELPAPSLDYSMEPSTEQPYAEYNLEVTAPGFESIEVNSAEVLANEIAIQNAEMMPLSNALGEASQLYVIPPHTLFGDYPPKIAESETKTVEETGEIVLSRVVIPEFIVVHDGPPTDSTAKNYYVKYADYIKNVASSEIYATWPESTIMANVLAIQSFVLNRVYTEWYRSKGYNFTITTSTAFDQKWIPGRNIFESISTVVDTIFANYLSRPNVKQPILTQYCDGNKVSCPNWMTQWGAKNLGDQGMSSIEILRYFYGETMYIDTATEVSGVPSSWPGADLVIGTRGDKVRQMQNQLNVISRNYPLIPKVAEDGVYGQQTAEAVRVFQGIFDLPKTGIVDFPTWYKISAIFVAVSRIAELV